MEVSEMVDGFIDMNNRIVKGLLEKNGGMHPMLLVLGLQPNQKTAIEHYTIPMPSIDDPRGKHFIAKVIIPMILKSAEEKGLTIICVAYFMDSWITIHEVDGLDKDAAVTKAREELKTGKVHKGSMLLCSYETKLFNKHYRFSYEVVNEKFVWGEVNTGGELMGRFANLWQTPRHN